MALTEKIISRFMKKDVVPGEYLFLSPDLLIVHEYAIYPQIMEDMKSAGIEEIRDPEKVMVVFDHACPAPHPQWAEKHRMSRRFVKKQNITKFYDIGVGISHQIAAELGYIYPGMFVTNGDPHVTTYGAFGCFAPTISMNSQLEIILTGDTWMQVPESICINVEGTFSECTGPRDLFMTVVDQLKMDETLGRALEFTGPAISALGVDERMSLCGFAPLAGAVNSVTYPDEKVLQYLDGRVPGKIDSWQVVPDGGYARTVTIDASSLSPVVSLPPDPLNVAGVDSVSGHKIDQGCIGSCLGGRMDEIRAAARILKGKKVHPEVRLVVTPSSKETYINMLKEGIVEELIHAGAVVDSPGCGACMGFKSALAPGETCITNSTQNIKGRMGSKEADIYLANASVIAASCIKGEIADPGDYI